MTVMNFENIREAKSRAYQQGLDAFADFVQHAITEAVKAAEQNETAKRKPPTWGDMALKLARIGGYITFDGMVNLREENPFTLKPYVPHQIAGELREFPKAGRPPKNTNAPEEPFDD